MKKIKYITALIIILNMISFAQNANLGTSGAQFLTIPTGPRAAALGGAVVGIIDDPSAIFWNPSGLTNIKSAAAYFTYMRYFEMFDYNAFAASYNLQNLGVISIGLISFLTDKMEITTEFSPQGTGRFFDASDLCLMFSYSRNLTDMFSFGVTAKYINQRIYNVSSSTIAFDIGTRYKIDFNNLVIAMSFSNFGPDLRFDGENLNVTHDIDPNVPLNRLTPARLLTDDYPLPLTFQVGVAIDLYKEGFFKSRFAIDAVHPNDNNERINFGLETSYYDILFLRGGYKYNYDDEAFSFGVGFNLPIGENTLAIDYSFSLFDILPDVHRIAVSINF